MLKKILIFQIFFLVVLGTAEAGRRVVAVRTISSSQSDQALAGFKSAVDIDITFLNASQFPRKKEIEKKIEQTGPDMVIAMGQEALLRVSEIKTLPVAYLFASNPDIVFDKDNFFGMANHLDYEFYMAAVKNTLPSVKNIGFLYNASKTEGILEKTGSAAKKNRLTVVAAPVEKPAQIVPALIGMVNRVDAILMYPDISIFTRDTLAFLFLYSMENHIPVISFSEKFITVGAAVSVSNNPYEAGREVGQLARKVFEGQSLEKKHLEGRSPVININNRVLKILGLRDSAIIKSTGSKGISRSQTF